MFMSGICCSEERLTHKTYLEIAAENFLLGQQLPVAFKR